MPETSLGLGTYIRVEGILTLGKRPPLGLPERTRGRPSSEHNSRIRLLLLS